MNSLIIEEITVAAGKLDLTIDKGATYRKPLVWKDGTGTPKDLTGYTAAMKIKERYNDTSFIVSLTDANGGLVITPAEGKIEIVIADDVTAAITESFGVYDLELVDSGGETTKLIRGKVSFVEEVTD